MGHTVGLFVGTWEPYRDGACPYSPGTPVFNQHGHMLFPAEEVLTNALR